MTPNIFTVNLVVFFFTFLQCLQLSKTLTAPSLLTCLSMCFSDSTCRGHIFHANKSNNNCELVSQYKPYSLLLDPFWLIDKTEATSLQNLQTGRSRKLIESHIFDKVAAAGFDVVLTLSTEKIFLKRMNTPMNIEEAQFACLGLGALLPLEDSDEFIDGMSTLVGDATSTRFISLVRELGADLNQPHLVWQTGRVETTNVGPSYSKYTSWNNRFFVVNPATKTYQSVSSTTIKSGFYCQYLGPNLAFEKDTYPSTKNVLYDPGSGVVDGVIDMNFWHASGVSPLPREWFAVDLGGNFLISYVLFLGRRECCGERSRFMKVWIGQVIPSVGQPLDNTKYQLCGEYPYIHGSGYLSGIACVDRVNGQVVILENGDYSNRQMQLTELLIF